MPPGEIFIHSNFEINKEEPLEKVITHTRQDWRKEIPKSLL